MKNGNITRFKLNPKKPPKTDWRAFDAMSEEERHRAALSDPDAPPAMQRALKNAPALVDVVTSQAVMSSDEKGLGFVPDYQALTAWDEAERKRRQT